MYEDIFFCDFGGLFLWIDCFVVRYVVVFVYWIFVFIILLDYELVFLFGEVVEVEVVKMYWCMFLE